ncbi:hypothetical protein Tco_0761760 [Tanacetum coccineum]
MACSLPHIVDEIHALVQKLIHEDNVRQKAMMDIAVQFDNPRFEDLRREVRIMEHLKGQRNVVELFATYEDTKLKGPQYQAPPSVTSPEPYISSSPVYSAMSDDDPDS